MKRRFSLPKAAPLALLAVALCGCAQTLSKAGAPPLAVNVSALDVCARVLAPVAFPPVTAKTDARIAFEKDEATILKARGEIDQGRNCIGDVKQRYAQPAK